MILNGRLGNGANANLVLSVTIVWIRPHNSRNSVRRNANSFNSKNAIAESGLYLNSRRVVLGNQATYRVERNVRRNAKSS